MKKAYIYAGTSILLWSTIATISKLLLSTMDSYQILYISALFASLTLFGFIIFSGRVSVLKQYKIKDYLIMIAIGLPGNFFYNLFLYEGTDRMLASQAFIINYLWPIMSVVFACILLKEKMTVRKAIAIVMSFLGVITVAGGDLLSFNTKTLSGVLLCVCAAISYGLFTALNQKWHFDKDLSMAVSFFSTFLISLVISLANGKMVAVGALQLAGIAFNGIFVLAIATTTWALALDSGKTAKISNLAYITPFLSLIWTCVFLHEPIKPLSVAGLAIIVIGIFIQLKDKK